MPIIQSKYAPNWWAKQMDISSIYAGKIRRKPAINYSRSRLTLPDNDFLHLDWLKSGNATIAILLHGLEGSSHRPYIMKMAQQYALMGVDSCCVNYRGCSGEPNKAYRTYHSGAIDDLQEVIDEVVSVGYQNIILHGFSLGANLSLFYAGSKPFSEPIKAVIAISAPCDLKGCCDQLLLPRNKIYSEYFRRTLVEKLYQKMTIFPDLVSSKEIKSIKTLYDFDRIYTSKAHGFTSAEDYYEKCSANKVLQHIQVPTLILNAQNDSFLSETCYPYAKAEQNPNLYLEVPRHGGHVAFVDTPMYYSERRAIDFLKEQNIL